MCWVVCWFVGGWVGEWERSDCRIPGRLYMQAHVNRVVDSDLVKLPQDKYPGIKQVGRGLCYCVLVCRGGYAESWKGVTAEFVDVCANPCQLCSRQ